MIAMIFLRFLVGISLLIKHPRLCFFKFRPARLRSLEKILLEELANRLNKEDARVLIQQIEEINLVERANNPHTIISFARIRYCIYDIKRSIKFSTKKDEYVLQKIDFNLGEKRIRAKIYVVYGNIFSIEFTSNISKYFSVDHKEIVFE